MANLNPYWRYDIDNIKKSMHYETFRCIINIRIRKTDLSDAFIFCQSESNLLKDKDQNFVMVEVEFVLKFPIFVSSDQKLLYYHDNDHLYNRNHQRYKVFHPNLKNIENYHMKSKS